MGSGLLKFHSMPSWLLRKERNNNGRWQKGIQEAERGRKWEREKKEGKEGRKEKKGRK